MLNSKVVNTLYFSNHRFLSGKKKLFHWDYAKLEDRLKIQLKLTEEGSKVTEKFFHELFQSVKELSEEVESNVTRQLTENIQAFNEVMLQKMRTLNQIK